MHDARHNCTGGDTLLPWSHWITRRHAGCTANHSYVRGEANAVADPLPTKAEGLITFQSGWFINSCRVICCYIPPYCWLLLVTNHHLPQLQCCTQTFGKQWGIDCSIPKSGATTINNQPWPTNQKPISNQWISQPTIRAVNHCPLNPSLVVSINAQGIQWEVVLLIRQVQNWAVVLILYELGNPNRSVVTCFIHHFTDDDDQP